MAAILVAAGSGQRLGAATPKAFCRVGGQTLLEHATRRFVGHGSIASVVVVAPDAHLDEAIGLVGKSAEPAVVQVVAGGSTRQLSVLAGLAALSPDVEFVLVHDVARPFVPRSMITRVVDALRAGADAVVPVVPVHDTIRRIDAAGAFAGVVDRSELVAVQTPQGFRRDALEAAHAAGTQLAVTDDAALVEAMGATVTSVPGSDAAFKITRPWDLTVAEALVEALVEAVRTDD